MNEIQTEIVLCLMHCVDNLHLVFIMEMKEKIVNYCQINWLYNFFEFIHSIGEDDFFNILICMQFDILDQFLKGMIYIVLEKNPATLWHLVLQWVVWLLQS